MNPARSLAPAVIMGGTALKQVWVFMIFPMVGAFISANLYMFLMGGNKKQEKKDVYVEMKDKE
jgi:aquaporin Z